MENSLQAIRGSTRQERDRTTSTTRPATSERRCSSPRPRSTPGFFAMAEKLDLCDIKNVATKMGVTPGRPASRSPMNTPSRSSAPTTSRRSPWPARTRRSRTTASTASRKAIDRVTDADGHEIPPPQTTCTQVLDPEDRRHRRIRAAGRHDAAAEPVRIEPERRHADDRQDRHARGRPDLDGRVEHEGRHGRLGRQLARASHRSASSGSRHPAEPAASHGSRRSSSAPPTTSTAATEFPEPDRDLTRQVLTDLPNVVGCRIDEATSPSTTPGSRSRRRPLDSYAAAGTRRGAEPGRGQGRKRNDGHHQPQQRQRCRRPRGCRGPQCQRGDQLPEVASASAMSSPARASRRRASRATARRPAPIPRAARW